MAETRLMRADEIANAFNGITDRKYWRAAVAGTRVNPEVHFNSRASMVQVVYRIAQEDFTVAFSKASTAFGDYLASVYRSLEQVMVSLVASGLPFDMPDELSAVLRLEYNPATKVATVHLDHNGARWQTHEPAPFKVPERQNDEEALSGVDAL